MQVYLGMLVNEFQRRRELVGVYQRDSGQHRRVGARREHKFDHRQVHVALEHARLELAREGIEEQEQAEQHDPRPLGTIGESAQVILAPIDVIRRRHEQGDSDPNEKCDDVVISRVCSEAMRSVSGE